MCVCVCFYASLAGRRSAGAVWMPVRRTIDRVYMCLCACARHSNNFLRLFEDEGHWGHLNSINNAALNLWNLKSEQTRNESLTYDLKQLTDAAACCAALLYTETVLHIFPPLSSLSYLLLLDLGLDHAVLGRWRLLIRYQLLCVAQPAEQRLQSILEFPTMQQGLLQLGDPLCHLRTAEMIVNRETKVIRRFNRVKRLYLGIKKEPISSKGSQSLKTFMYLCRIKEKK